WPALQLSLHLFFIIPRPPPPPLFPYTTLFRSRPILLLKPPLPSRNGSSADRTPRSNSIAVSISIRKAATFTPFLMTPSTRWSCRSEEHTSELQSLRHLVCRLLLEKKKKK